MFLPGLTQPRRRRASVTAFAGYRHTAACAEGWFYEEENLSARDFPALSPRLPRTLVDTLAAPGGIGVKNGLVWAAGGRLYYNGADMGAVSEGEKQFCGMGAKVLIWPDKLCLDTAALTLTPLGAKWVSTGAVSFTPCLADGTAYTLTHTGPAAPEAPAAGDYWLDTSGAAHVLRVYSAATDTWNGLETTCIRIGGTGLGAGFAAGDTVFVSGISEAAVPDASLLNTALAVWDAGPDWITVTGLLDAAAVQSAAQGAVTVERRIPDLDYLTMQDNRVWGCSSADHTIYACKLGDATNWFSYQGTAADSYAVTVGTDGDFTGAATCLGYVLFFKAGCIHKVYGTKPANYQITTITAPGTAAGGAKTLVQAGGALYYLSARGVMRYDGSLPVCISQPLGEPVWASGCAGAAGPVVYFCLRDAAGSPALYTYDTEKELWHREDPLDVLAFAADDVTLYALTQTGALWAMGGVPDAYANHPGREQAVRWSAETGPIGLLDADNRFVSRITLRLQGQAGATVAVAASWDGGPWQTLGAKTMADGQTLLLPILPRRCAAVRLRLSGTGQVRLYSLAKIIEQGSELTNG